ncbi:hypothetical protein FZW96_11940 [Bacillus sp. BGMRC 2118]|nr:hypothetical protein FZW96_11940 [Bacillus sp. BGMRC 2118]
MDRNRVVDLFKIIKMFYENFEVSSEKVDYWHSILKKHDFKTVEENLLQHVETSVYPPKIAEIIKKNHDDGGWEINHEHLAKMRERRKGVYDDPGF